MNSGKTQVVYRRQAIFDLLVKGKANTYEIADKIETSQSTVVRDIQFLKAQSVQQMKFHIHERLPFVYRVCSEGISEVLRHTWNIILQENGRANKIAALSLIAQLYKDQLELFTNAFVITEALAAVETMKNQILGIEKLSTNETITDPIISHIK